MTADHPTREERYAAVLAEHPSCRYDAKDEADPTGSRHFIRCNGRKCNARLIASTYGELGAAHRAHVAAALVAADPAPPAVEWSRLAADDGWEDVDEAALRGRAVEAVAWGLLDATMDVADREPSAEAYLAATRTASRLLAADAAPAQPDAALSDGEREALLHWLHGGSAGGIQSLWAMVNGILAARAAQPVPAPNPILADALTYYTERRTMNNPKGWAHVLRKVEQGIEANLWPTATAEHIEQARAALTALTSVPAPEVSRGVAEVKAEALREAADALLNDTTLRRGHNVSVICSCLRCEVVRECADRLVRDALPADDGADCCRERTTAGGCGCGGE